VSKSPLRSSLKKVDSEDPIKSGKASPQHFQTFSSLQSSGNSKAFIGLREDFSH